MDVFNAVMFFEIMGTAAFAISGAILGIKKNMDIFGVSILGIATGVGGGIIRDILLANLPPLAFRDPLYLIVALIASIVIFLKPVRNMLYHDTKIFDRTLLVFDSIGLGIFTVSGIATAFSATAIHGIVLMVTVGVLTGCGGGVLRDIMAGEKPQVFVREFYASASLIGAVVCFLTWKPLGKTTAMTIAAALIVILRLLAVKFNWRLPRAGEYKNKKEK